MKTESYWEVCWEQEGGSASLRYDLDCFESAADQLIEFRASNPDKKYVLMMVSRVDVKF